MHLFGKEYVLVHTKSSSLMDPDFIPCFGSIGVAILIAVSEPYRLALTYHERPVLFLYCFKMTWLHPRTMAVMLCAELHCLIYVGIYCKHLINRWA